jgi:hypothetical protein
VGKLNVGGAGKGGATYALFAGKKKVASGKTNSSGAFTKLVPLTKATRFRATADVDPQSADGTCAPMIPISTNPLILPTCTGITEAGIAADSNAVTVKKTLKRRR